MQVHSWHTSCVQASRELQTLNRRPLPGAPQLARICSLKMRCSRPPPPAAAPAVGASRYISEKFRMLPTCAAAAQTQGLKPYAHPQGFMIYVKPIPIPRDNLRMVPTCPAAAQPEGPRAYVRFQITPSKHMYQIQRHTLLDAMLPIACPQASCCC